MKEKRENLKINLVFNLIYQAVNVLSPLIITPKLSRVFGLEYLGIKSYTFSIVYYFSILGVLGLDLYGQRIIAMEKDDIEKRSKSFWTIFFARLMLGVIVLGLYVCFVFAITASPIERIVSFCWSIYLVRGMINPIWFLQGIEKYKLISIVEIASQVLYVICTLCFINEKGQLPFYIGFYTAIPLIFAVYYFRPVLQNVCSVNVSGADVFMAIKSSVVYFIPTIATALYSMIDKTMLGVFDTSKISTGLYESTEKLVKVALAISTSSFTIMRTRMSYLFGQKNKNEYGRQCRQFISLSMMLCWPIMFGIIGIAQDFVPFFFGNGFEDVVHLSYYFSMVVPCLTISGLLQAIYIFPYGLQKTMDYYYIIIVMVNASLNLVLIYKFGVLGAIGASIVAELLLAIILICKARKDIDVVYIFLCSVKYFVAAVIMLFCIRFISDKISINIVEKLMVEFLSAVLSYFGMCVLLRDTFVLGELKRLILIIGRKDKHNIESQ